MRIRSIRPEFWSSEDVAGMSWETRLVFIGLWSYVDDNGVGRDHERLIVAALFPLDPDLPECSRRVTGALRHLSNGGQITRYTVEGRSYLHITTWTRHQRIEKASQGRYPLPTCDNAEIPEHSGSTPGVVPDMSPPGEGEKGRRGEGEKVVKASSAEPMTRTSTTLGFDEFWKHYPRKVSKDAARRAFVNAVRRKVDPQLIIDGARRYAADPNLPDMEFVPHPPKWINDGRWNDPPCVTRSNGRVPATSTTDQRVSAGISLAQRYAEQEASEQRLEIEA